MNADRVRHGLQSLRYSPELATASSIYAAAMAASGFFGHQAPDGGTLITRAEAAGYRDWTDLGENLAAGGAPPGTIVAAWMASPSHRANLLSPVVRDVGAGYVSDPRSLYGHYWVLKMGSRASWVPVMDAIPFLYTPGRLSPRPVRPRPG